MSGQATFDRCDYQPARACLEELQKLGALLPFPEGGSLAYTFLRKVLEPLKDCLKTMRTCPGSKTRLSLGRLTLA